MEKEQNKNSNILNKLTNDLDDVQSKLMSDSRSIELWTGEESLQKRIYVLEQELHWAQSVKKDEFLFGDKKTKYFQMEATIYKRKNHIRNIMDKNGLWSDYQNDFAGSFKRIL